MTPATPILAQNAQPQTVTADLSKDATQDTQTPQPRPQSVRLSEFHPSLEAYRYAQSIQDGASAQAHLVDFLANNHMVWAYDDTLLQCYFDYRNLVPCIRLADKILTTKPNHLFALNIAAQSYQLLGQPKLALPYYEKHQQLSPTPYVLYQIAAMQFELERNKECATSLEQLLKMELKGEELAIFGGTHTDRVPMEAAAWNMIGSLQYRQGDWKAARQAFETALKLHPKYHLAQQNLDQVKGK
jgi:tetratricopeptide (TPR) repeat protein